MVVSRGLFVDEGVGGNVGVAKCGENFIELLKHIFFELLYKSFRIF